MLPDVDWTGMSVGFQTCTRSYVGVLFRCRDKNAVLGVTHSLSAILHTGARQAGSHVCVGLAPGPHVLRPWHTPPPAPPAAQMWGAVPGPEPSGGLVRSPYYRLVPQHTAVPLTPSVIGLNALGAEPAALCDLSAPAVLSQRDLTLVQTSRLSFLRNPRAPHRHLCPSPTVCVCLGWQHAEGLGTSRREKVRLHLPVRRLRARRATSPRQGVPTTCWV